MSRLNSSRNSGAALPFPCQKTALATATLYLDEQPLTFRGQVPDLHHYDIERIEILNGPQGTHYAASAPSGAVRIIANKPDPDAFSAGADVSAGSIKDGDHTRTVEGFVNIPLADGRERCPC